MRTFVRRVKGALVNALFWGFVWFWFGAGVSLLFRLPGAFDPGAAVLIPTLRAGLGAGLFGAAIGGGFSIFIAANFRHQRVETLSAGRFALGGGLVTAAAVLLGRYLTGAEWLIDQALVSPVELYGGLALQALVAAAVGGFTAYGTIRLARRGADLERIEAGGETDEDPKPPVSRPPPTADTGSPGPARA